MSPSFSPGPARMGETLTGTKTALATSGRRQTGRLCQASAVSYGGLVARRLFAGIRPWSDSRCWRWVGSLGKAEL